MYPRPCATSCHRPCQDTGGLCRLGGGLQTSLEGPCCLGGCGHGLGVHLPPWGYQLLECGWASPGLGGGLPPGVVDKARLRASALPGSPQGAGGPPLGQGEGMAAPSTPPGSLGRWWVSELHPHQDLEGGSSPRRQVCWALRGNTSMGEPCCRDTHQPTAVVAKDVNGSHFWVFFSVLLLQNTSYDDKQAALQPCCGAHPAKVPWFVPRKCCCPTVLDTHRPGHTGRCWPGSPWGKKKGGKKVVSHPSIVGRNLSFKMTA